MLDAKNAVSLSSALNSEQSTGKNSSKGGSLGVGLTAGSGGAGLSVSASVNRGKGSETGNSLTHGNTTVTAGNRLSLQSGGDTTLQGAQVQGNRIDASVGGNLTIASQQDSDRYDSRQQNASAGGSYTFGAGGGSGSISATRDKIHSNYDSVKEQSGIFAGDGGFDITVGNHTQLDGGVIASTATADKNSLNTGTLGWSDIHNQADVKSEHQGMGLSSGGSIGGQFTGNMENTLLAGVNHSDHAEGTTKVAVSEGSIVIRDKDAQQQDLSQLNRDTEHANGSIAPIFNKEKEQQRLAQAQLIAEIGSQAADIVRTQGTINATRKATEQLKNLSAAEREQARDDWQKANPGKTATPKDISDQAYKTLYDRAMNASGMGTGGWAQRAVQAATAVVQGLAGGDMAKAIAGGSAPYIAEVIGRSGLDTQGKLAAHAVVNAVLAAVQGNSALAGAAGGVTAELVGILATEMYGKQAEELSESEKQTVSALATIAASLAGGLAGNSTADAVAGGQAGKTTVENNWLSATQIDAWSAEMKSCQAKGGDCGSIVKKYEELSTAQQQQLISDCASNPATCQQKYGGVLADSLAVKQAIDRALGEDIPIKMVYDLTATFAQQMQAEGVVATQKVSEALQKEYGLDGVQADILAGAAAAAFGGVSKAGKGSPVPVPVPVKAANGLNYQSNPKHTQGTKDFGGSKAGIEPKNSLDLFGSSVPISDGKKRFTMDSDGNIHQFMSDGTGNYHWAGSTADKRNPLRLDNRVKSELRKQQGWKIK